MKFIDNILDHITMYRLVLYYLIFLILAASVLSLFDFVPFTTIELLFSAVFLFAVCYIVNGIFSKLFNAPVNNESYFITALILALIFQPAASISEYILLFWVATLAMGSKYILAIHKKHIFNPAALAAVVVGLSGIGAASWWVGTLPMLPFALMGIFIVRKIRRFSLVTAFFVAALITIEGLSMLKGSDPFTVLQQIMFESPIVFFAFIMLTEPLTMPPTRQLQIAYGSIVGFLFSPQIQFAGFYTTPELALLVGNVFAYIVSPKYKLLLRLKNKFQESDDICNFYFPRPASFVFTPGQYMEWTLPHKSADSRGNRRYFTIASSPTEDTINLGIRFTNNGSSFKKAMDNLTDKNQIMAGNLAGDFTLPEDKTKKLVFIAGGIGITPIRSIIKYLLDKKESRDVVVFYSNKTKEEIVYKDVFAEADKKLGIKTFYVLTGEESIPKNSNFEKGRITEQMIKKDVPDYKNRIYYLSGPQAMVDSYKALLGKLGIPFNQIVTDYFPGFA